MASFSENLQRLPKVEDVERIELSDAHGMPAGVIENKPGQTGSLAIYHYLLGKYGDVNAAAAGEGLQLYSAHTEDAKENPCKPEYRSAAATGVDREFLHRAHHQAVDLGGS